MFLAFRLELYIFFNIHNNLLILQPLGSLLSTLVENHCTRSLSNSHYSLMPTFIMFKYFVFILLVTLVLPSFFLKKKKLRIFFLMYMSKNYYFLYNIMSEMLDEA